MPKKTSSSSKPATSSLVIPETSTPHVSEALSAHSALQHEVAGVVTKLIQANGFDRALTICLEKRDYPAIILLFQTQQAQGGKGYGILLDDLKGDNEATKDFFHFLLEVGTLPGLNLVKALVTHSYQDDFPLTMEGEGGLLSGFFLDTNGEVLILENYLYSGVRSEPGIIFMIASDTTLTQVTGCERPTRLQLDSKGIKTFSKILSFNNKYKDRKTAMEAYERAQDALRNIEALEGGFPDEDDDRW